MIFEKNSKTDELAFSKSFFVLIALKATLPTSVDGAAFDD
jgi:hypothetical protein